MIPRKIGGPSRPAKHYILLPKKCPSQPPCCPSVMQLEFQSIPEVEGKSFWKEGVHFWVIAGEWTNYTERRKRWSQHTICVKARTLVLCRVSMACVLYDWLNEHEYCTAVLYYSSSDCAVIISKQSPFQRMNAHRREQRCEVSISDQLRFTIAQ